MQNNQKSDSMKNKIIKYNEGLKAIWINTTNVDEAHNIALDFLKKLETSEYEFKIDTCKRNSNLIKVEYSCYIKSGSKINIERDIMYSRKYSLEIINKNNQSKKNIINTLDIIEKNIDGLTIDKCNSIQALDIGCKLTLSYYQNYGGDIVNKFYNIIRMS